MANSPRLGLRRPQGADAFHPAADMTQHADVLDDAAIDQQGSLAARPPAPTAVGTYYYATDTELTYRWNGTSWKTIGYRGVGGIAAAELDPNILNRSGLFASRPSASAVDAGTMYFATDTGDVSRSDGTNWFTLTPENRCSFQAVSASDQVVANGTTATVAFATEVFDQGNNFAGNVLTAPVSGIYEFAVRLEISSGVPGGDGAVNPFLRKNGATSLFTFDGSMLPGERVEETVRVQLAAGDTVDVRYPDAPGGSTSTLVGERNRFGGSLICQIP